MKRPYTKKEKETLLMTEGPALQKGERDALLDVLDHLPSWAISRLGRCFLVIGKQVIIRS